MNLLHKCMLFLAYNWFDHLYWEHMVKKKDLSHFNKHVLFACSANGEGRKRSLSGCSTDSLTLVPPRRVSWRQKIFLRVASPMNKPSASMQNVGRYTCLSVCTDKQTGSTLHPVLPSLFIVNTAVYHCRAWFWTSRLLSLLLRFKKNKHPKSFFFFWSGEYTVLHSLNNFITLWIFSCHLSMDLRHFVQHLLFSRPHGWPGAAATFSSGFEPGSRLSGQPSVPRAGLWWREVPALPSWLQGPVEESYPPTDFAHPHGEREPASGRLVFLLVSFSPSFSLSPFQLNFSLTWIHS